ncbi:MFS transporter [Amycolatopsis sp. VS8301801F10]|uniref:MFS transporter n=1 Tax=Amycolatopsis sp. VS8301801F10 TaxID=2652442 RepID=UPI0038FC16E7
MNSARRRCTLIAVSLATFMAYLDNNIVNVALPSIQEDLRFSVSGLEWVVSAYILVFGTFLLFGGRLGDIHGWRPLFLIGLGLFTLSSLVAGLAASPGMLVAGRACQGLGAAAVTPTTLAIISAAYPDERQRANAVGVWNAVGALALAVGPLLGGVLSQHLSWGWIFFVNVPVGVATLALGAWAIRLPKPAGRKPPLDVAGTLASGGALFALTFSLIEGHDSGWGSPAIVGGFVAAVLLAAVFAVVETRVAHPMLNIGLLGERVFGGGVATMFIWAFGLFGIFFFTSLYLQDVLRFSPTEAGLAFVPMAVLMIAGSVLSGWAAARFGAHRSVSGAMALIAAGIAGAALLDANATFAEVMPPLLVIGIGGGFTTSLTATVLAAMPGRQAGVATAVFSTVRQIGGLLGVTVIGAVLTARQTAEAHRGAPFREAFLSGYHQALLVAAVLVAVGAVIANFALRARLPGNDPRPFSTED